VISAPPARLAEFKGIGDAAITELKLVHAAASMTQTIIDVARPLGIAVHDHIIVGKQGHVSFKSLRLI
jgi:DNA repair protein RadC